MKKLLFVLFLSFACTSIYAQVKANSPSTTMYCNGDSYGFYIDEIPGAVSYTWSVLGWAGGATIWPGWDTAIDMTFSKPGIYDIICTVQMDSGPDQVYGLAVDVYEE
ncbi:hypothetical protein D3C87_1409320 [compost metagenome]